MHKLWAIVPYPSFFFQPLRAQGHCGEAFPMRYCASMWLKGLHNCKRSNLEVIKAIENTAEIQLTLKKEDLYQFFPDLNL